jgi:hypothetical protein
MSTARRDSARAAIRGDIVNRDAIAQQCAIKLAKIREGLNMKKILLLAALAFLAVFITGRISLGEAGAMRFVTQMESLMREGKADEVCAMFHDDLTVNIIDHSTPDGSLEGGKAELCEHTRMAAAALEMLPHSMNVDFEDVAVSRRWLHPWTSEVTYLERRALTIAGANVSVRTVSEDTLTLVQTFSGVKLRKLTADVSLAE